MPVWTPPGPNPFDPRQPKQIQPVQRPVPVIKNKIYTQQSPISPIHLSAKVVLDSGSSGAASVASLKNPMGQDMEITEIKFEVSGDITSGVNPIFGGTIACELVMGDYKLTNGAIPIWCFGRAENLAAEAMFDTQTGFIFQSYAWRLPRPLFVAAGGAVVPTFTHTAFVKQKLNVRIGYSARTVTARPKKLYLPWVAKYASKAFNPISAADVDSSSQLDLVNPNPEPLHLQRFVGRTMQTDDNGRSIDDPVFPAFSDEYLNLRMTDSYGRPIIKNYTPFRVAFSALTRTWEMDNGTVLDPESYYLVNLKKDAMVVAVEGSFGQAFVSMVGWRELGVA